MNECMNEISTIPSLRKHKLNANATRMNSIIIIWMYLHHKIQTHTRTHTKRESEWVYLLYGCKLRWQNVRSAYDVEIKKPNLLTCVISAQISSQLNDVDATSNWLLFMNFKVAEMRFLWFECCFHTFVINQCAYLFCLVLLFCVRRHSCLRCFRYFGCNEICGCFSSGCMLMPWRCECFRMLEWLVHHICLKQP